MSKVDPGIEEPNDQFVTAVSPTQADLMPTTGDYEISKNDLLTVEIPDLTAPGATTVKAARVTESGNISLPLLGQVHAEGMTEIELEKAVNDRYKAEGILQRPQVSITVTEARGRAFEIMGAVNQTGQYAIFEPDFRLLDALVIARDTTSPLLEDVYIIRRTDRHRGGAAGDTQPGAGTAPGTAPGTGVAPATRPGGGVDDLAPRPARRRLAAK